MAIGQRSGYVGMRSGRSRQKAVWSLVHFEHPAEELEAILSEFPWDCAQPLVTLHGQNVCTILQRYLAGELSSGAVERWANLVELRDDIHFADQSVLEAIFTLANPTANGTLNAETAQRLIAELSLS